MAYLDIRRRNVAHHIEMVIYHSNGRDSFAVHDLQGFAKELVTTGSLSDMLSNASWNTHLMEITSRDPMPKSRRY